MRTCHPEMRSSLCVSTKTRTQAKPTIAAQTTDNPAMHRIGKVKNQTPKVTPQQSTEKKKSTGRSKFRTKFNELDADHHENSYDEDNYDDDDEALIEDEEDVEKVEEQEVDRHHHTNNNGNNGNGSSKKQVPSLVKSINTFELSRQKAEERSQDRKMRNIEFRKEKNERDRIKRYLSEVKDELTEKYESYFTYFHIEPTQFWTMDRDFNLLHNDSIDVKKEIAELFEAQWAWNASRSLNKLCILATSDRYRAQIVKNLPWRNILFVFDEHRAPTDSTKDGHLTDNRGLNMDHEHLIMNLIAIVASFPDTHGTLFQNKIHEIVFNYLRYLFDRVLHVDSKLKGEQPEEQQILVCCRILSKLFVNDQYQCNSEYSFVLRMMLHYLQKQNFDFEAPKSKKKFDRASFEFELMEYGTNILANLSSLNSFDGKPKESIEAVELLILLSHYQDSEQLSFNVDLLVMNLLARDNFAKALSHKSSNSIVQAYWECIENDMKNVDGSATGRAQDDSDENVQHLLGDTIISPFESGTDIMLTKEDYRAREIMLASMTRSNIVYVASRGGGGKCHKPVIYLYSDRPNTAVNVHLAFDGTFTHLYPSPSTVHHDKSISWNVETRESGEIGFNGHSYKYLFWEGDLQQRRTARILCQFTRHSATLVPTESVTDYLEERLSAQGMIDHEIQDFITYWLPHLNKHKYNYIQFVDREYTDAAPLTTQPAFDNCLRVFMVFAGCDYPRAQLPQPSLSHNQVPSDATFQRSGALTLVEWGGMDLTCYTKNLTL